MESMKEILLIILLGLLATNLKLVQGLRNSMSPGDKSEVELQLQFINKPATMSFQTEHGDILDCIEINKQLAFDHPLLKNHTIQMEPSSNIQRLCSSSSRLKVPQLLPKNMRCPKGTVLIKRVQKEDLLMAKLVQSSFGMKLAHHEENDASAGHKLAILQMPVKNVGIDGNLNVWGPTVADDQFSASKIYAASVDGSFINGVVAGWIVYPYLYSSYTRLFIYWTRDSGNSTGCFNMVCPGFVQVSQSIPIGVILNPLSTYDDQQYEIRLTIIQDDITGNWWLRFRDENVGYYPKELFTTFADGATMVAWGGEIYSSVLEAYPAMGSGHFPEEGFRKASYIRQMKVLDPSYSAIYPDNTTLRQTLSRPQCYGAFYAGDYGGETGHTMFFGGPPGCQPSED